MEESAEGRTGLSGPQGQGPVSVVRTGDCV